VHNRLSFVLDCVVIFTTGHALARVSCVLPAAASEREGGDLLSPKGCPPRGQGCTVLCGLAEEASPPQL